MIYLDAFIHAAESFPDRSEVQCLHRWQKVLNPELVKGPWTQEVSLFRFFSLYICLLTAPCKLMTLKLFPLLFI